MRSANLGTLFSILIASSICTSVKLLKTAGSVLGPQQELEENVFSEPSRDANQPIEIEIGHGEAKQFTTGQFLDHLDLNQSSCGFYKCFFPTKSDPRIGWLVGENVTFVHEGPKIRNPTLIDTMVEGWEVAKDLEEKFGIKHFLLGPPIVLDTPTKSQLNDLTANVRILKHKKLFGGEKTLVAQQVRIAPSHILVRCDGQVDRTLSKLRVFIDGVDNKEEFMDQLKGDVKTVVQILKEYPPFLEDFQFMLDSSGSIHHLDFDRVWTFERKRRHDRKKCVSKLNGLVALAEFFTGTSETYSADINSQLANMTATDFLGEFNLTQSTCEWPECFFPSTSDPTVGWLVAEDQIQEPLLNTSQHTISEVMYKGWRFARELEIRYHINHFILEPPVILPNLSPSDQTILNSNLPKNRQFDFTAHYPIVVQKLAATPSSKCIVLRCSNRGYDMSKLETFLELVENGEDFSRRLQVDTINLAIKILQEYPAASQDFQLSVDAKGGVCRINFDRFYQTSSNLMGEGEGTWLPNDECQTNLRTWADEAVKRIKARGGGISEKNRLHERVKTYGKKRQET